MNTQPRLRQIKIDGRDYKYIVDCFKCKNVTLMRVTVEFGPSKVERFLSGRKLKYADLIEFIRSNTRIDKAI